MIYSTTSGHELHGFSKISYINNKLLKHGIKIKQQDISDCGVACLASVCAYFNLRLSIAQLRLLTNTDQRGTTVLGIVEAATKLGFLANGVRATPQSLPSIPTPAIAHFRKQNHSHHYIVVLKVEATYVEIMDPADGDVYKMKIEEFERVWTNILIILYPPKAFLINNQTRSFSARILEVAKSLKYQLCYYFLAALLYTMLGLSISYYLKLLIDKVIPYHNGPEHNENTIGIFLFLSLALALAFTKGKLAIRINEELNAKLLFGYCKHILGLPQSFFDQMKTGEVLSRITDAIKIRTFITDILINFIITLLVIFLALALIFTYYWKLGIMMLLIFPAYACVFFFTNRANKKFEKELLENTASFESLLIESVDKMQSIKLSNAQDLFLKKLSSKFNSLTSSVKNSSFNQLISTISTDGIARYFTLILLWFGTTLILKGEITTGELFSFYAIVGFFTGPASSLVAINQLFQNAKIASERFFEIMDLPVQDEVNSAQSAPLSFDNIHVRQVNFRYGARSTVFNNLNLILRKGQITAITGPSGSGKSTLAALLTKIYPPNAGEILFDTLNINDINAFDLREQVALVPQRPELFSGSLLENIIMAPSPDPARLERTFHTLGLHSFMKSLPEGLHTHVGEHGTQLSGGQIQLVALARAVYKDPSVYILDEPTAAMDSGLEEKTLQLISTLRASGKTIILITHRLSTLSIADHIAVLRDGTVAEEGTYKELLEGKGEFYRMWRGASDQLKY